MPDTIHFTKEANDKRSAAYADALRIEKLAALDRLIASVEAGAWDGSWRWLLDNIWHIEHCETFNCAYHGSLDAALSLKDALLTKDCHWSVAECDDRGFFARVYLSGWHEYSNASPARALLLATLKAYRHTVAEGQG